MSGERKVEVTGFEPVEFPVPVKRSGVPYNGALNLANDGKPGVGKTRTGKVEMIYIGSDRAGGVMGIEFARAAEASKNRPVQVVMSDDTDLILDLGRGASALYDGDYNLADGKPGAGKTVRGSGR